MNSRYDITDPKNVEIVDPDLQLTRDDYRKPALPREGAMPEPATNIVEPEVPDMAEILAAPKPPKLGETQLVSVAVTDDVPLKDVLIELARLADVDVEVDAGITGGISFRAKDRPFNEVIDRIADLAGLRYTMKNNVLRIERDMPYIQVYTLDFLNMERNATGNVTINTSVLAGSGVSGGGGGGESGGLNSGSNMTITTRTDNDFWAQFEGGVRSILEYRPAALTSETTIATQPASPARPAGATTTGGGAASSAPTGGGSVSSTGSGDLFYILNRQAATLTVSAADSQHDLLRRFISKIRTSLSAQVLIEAKIVEVSLKDQFQSGIDWTALGGSKVSLVPTMFDALDTNSTTTTPINTNNVATFNFLQNNLTGMNIDLELAVQLAELFGTTRTLSSPRLHALNNQQAMLTFAQNQVYYTLTITQQNTTDTGGNTVSNIQVQSQVHTVPIGIIMTLQPSINLESNEVTLNIRPSLSKVVAFVNDPAVAFLLTQLPDDVETEGLISQIPVVQVRELDSMLKLKSGQVMVIGGLMSDESTNTDQGVPGVSTIPYLGNLFKATNKAHNMTELVIFIRATIVGSTGSADSADKTVYEKFNNDPRPLNF